MIPPPWLVTVLDCHDSTAGRSSAAKELPRFLAAVWRMFGPKLLQDDKLALISFDICGRHSSSFLQHLAKTTGDDLLLAGTHHPDADDNRVAL